MTITDANVLFQTRNSSSERANMGTMYELVRHENTTDIFVDTEFSMETLKAGWRSIHAHLVGETSFTHEMISEEGEFLSLRPG
jgi:hypothetical protein